MNKTRRCSICKKPIPYNSGSFTWDIKTGYVHDSCKVKEIMKVSPPGGLDTALSKDKAVKIATRLKDFSDEKKFEVGRFIAPLKEETEGIKSNEKNW